MSHECGNRYCMVRPHAACPKCYDPATGLYWCECPEIRGERTLIADLDGTLADVEHRRRLLADGSLDARHFHAPSEMEKDLPRRWVAEVVRSLWRDGWRVIVVSARSDSHRAWTEQWLLWNEIPFDPLVMRQARDSREDVLVKRDILNALREAGFRPTVAIDDRRSVVDMWRAEGLVCLQCDPGDWG